MTDREIYMRWERAYNALDTRYLRGELDAEAFDHLVLIMEERLGLTNWSVERWIAAGEEGA